MIRVLRTDSENTDFIMLVKYLDAYLAEMDGEEHAFYAAYNKTNKIKYVVVAYHSDIAVGCGAIKEYSSMTMEVKRMYTLPAYRGNGIATRVLLELEKWAAELSSNKCILETGIKQNSAIQLYRRNGYKKIPNYGQYAVVENSVCFEKELLSK